MPPRLKHRMTIAKSLEATKERHPTENTFESQNRDPEGEKIVWNLDGYAKWKTGYNMRLYSEIRKHLAHDGRSACGRREKADDHEEENFLVQKIQRV